MLLQRIAPHLVRPVPFLFPLAHPVWERPYIGAGMILYDTLGFSFGAGRGVPGHRHLTRKAALRVAPALKRSAFRRRSRACRRGSSGPDVRALPDGVGQREQERHRPHQMGRDPLEEHRTLPAGPP